MIAEQVRDFQRPPSARPARQAGRHRHGGESSAETATARCPEQLTGTFDPGEPAWAALQVVRRGSLRATEFLSEKQLRQHIASYIAGWNEEPRPFIWTKPAVAIIQSHCRMIARIS